MASLFSKTPDIQETLFNLRLAQKQIEKQATKCEKDASAQKLKIKKAIQQGNVDGAKIYAENAIRKKNEGNNYLRMAARLDAVQNKVKSAMMMQDIAKSIGKVSKNLESALKSMDLEKMGKTMAEFETVFENLDLHEQVTAGALDQATVLTTPGDQVDSLIMKVAEENGIDVENKLAGLSAVPTEQAETQKAKTEDDILDQRLAELRALS